MKRIPVMNNQFKSIFDFSTLTSNITKDHTARDFESVRDMNTLHRKVIKLTKILLMYTPFINLLIIKEGREFRFFSDLGFFYHSVCFWNEHFSSTCIFFSQNV